MTCARFVDTETAERYVLGRMTEAEQSAFEEHYFACDECFETVQALQDLQTALRTSPVHASKDEASTPRVPSAAAASTGPSSPTNATARPIDTDLPAASASSTAGASATTGARPPAAPIPISAGRRKPAFSPTLLVGLAAAASVLVGIVVWQRQSVAPQSPPVIAKNDPPAGTEQPPPIGPAPVTPTPGSGQGSTPGSGTPGSTPSSPSPTPAPPAAPPRSILDYAALAIVVPPSYVPLQTRGAEPAPQADAFQAAMARYAAKDYRGAIEGLRPVAEANAADGRTQFFLGVSHLMTNDAPAAATALEQAVASGAAPFATEAHFYLAKAALREKDLPRATRELTLAVQHEAGPPGEAARLLRQIRQAQTPASPSPQTPPR